MILIRKTDAGRFTKKSARSSIKLQIRVQLKVVLTNQ